MSAAEVDGYVAAQQEPHRETMSELRDLLLELVPGADQGLSYGAPAFRVRGKAVAGFSAAKNHVTYLPFSGTVVAAIDQELLEGFTWSKGAVQFPLGQSPSRELVAALVAARLAQIA